ncbi:DUF2514 family protein [Pseudomonas kurunegalensis]|uniref:DUF2514 domain-containing protein n=1 Tax=Pseudomonas kurunegalensis TaxID=485880 RepID=A0ACC5UKD8_9PSED|nr:DUF2514 family protein [Pseudomonas kurunegalensis]MBV4514917.1 DUF2514 domain-containing protein [Pseudomonas kurunegalensis]
MEQLVRLVPTWCWWLAALLLVAAGQQYRVVVAQGETGTARGQLADYRLEVAERDRRAAAQARTEEQRRQIVADEEGQSARKKLELAQGRAADAESAADGLRGEIVRLRNGHRATCDTIATQQRQAGTSAVVVLGGLLEEADRMAGSCAAALERSRIAGLACETIYREKSTSD